MINAQLDETWRYPQMLAIGDNVKIVEGPWSDFDGTIKDVRPSEEKVRVAISIFGRAETIELDFSEIKPAIAN
jgi:transcription termination/antitermination protein NusG